MIINTGFQGIKGSFSEEALYKYFNKTDIKAINYKNFEDVFIAIENNQIKYGVLPIENSWTGAITNVYDLLNKYNCFITGEVFLKPVQNLLGTADSSIDTIKEVYSHPQGFEQSTNFLNKYSWKLSPYYNTALSAKYIKELNDKSVAAIASKKAAQLYNLKILQENINDTDLNTTRFVVIGKTLEVNSDCDKISILLSTKHKAGALYNLLKYFAENNINMLKIESRPIKHTPWEYYFYIDLEGNIHDDTVKKAIEQIKHDCHYFRILGNYKNTLNI